MNFINVLLFFTLFLRYHPTSLLRMRSTQFCLDSKTWQCYVISLSAPFYNLYTLILYCACVLHISAWDRNSVPLVFLHSFRHIYRLPFYNYMVTHKMFHFLLYDVIPHYHNSDKFWIPSDHFRLHPSTFQLFPKIHLCIVRAEGRPYYLTTFKVSIA